MQLQYILMLDDQKKQATGPFAVLLLTAEIENNINNLQLNFTSNKNILQ
jgi:hypothetical protein